MAQHNNYQTAPLKKSNRDRVCLVCTETIAKGELYRATPHKHISICKPCDDCWREEGGVLRKISRSKIGY
jgi:hypothetical protein